MNKGNLVVIDGVDGSGKTTQVNLLSKYLAEKNIPYEVISFPQYGKNEYSKKIKDYLEGHLGKLAEVDPYFIAKEYASDRLTAKDLIKSWLMMGKLVIANRYVSASKAHLGANLPDEKKEEFMEWIDRLEYQTNGMPKPDLTILLKVDPKIGQENALKDHLTDIHEKSLEHEEKAAKIYFKLSQAEENWFVVDCMKDGGMKSPEDIQNEILRIVNKNLRARQ